MERLTARKEDGKVIYASSLRWEAEDEQAILDKLCEYEDKLESGQLVELPCIVETLSPKYKVIVFRGKDGKLYKTHTFEASEAEARLKELQEGK